MFTDGSDGTWHHKHQKHHNNHHRHHTRQRRQEWSPSQAIHEKRNEGSLSSGSVRSEITFGHETQVAEEWVFLTRNATTVKAHIGSTAILPCKVKKESQFGMVRFFFQLLLLRSSSSLRAALIADSISALIPESTQACFLE